MSKPSSAFACVALRVGQDGDGRGTAIRSSSDFTAYERRALGSRSTPSWVGHLAAKQAVAQLLGATVGTTPALGEVEIRSVPIGLCFDGRRCRRGHPPSVVLSAGAARTAGEDAGRLGISITHDAGVAIAMAYLMAGPARANRPAQARTPA
jgi:hypothetical protein